MPCSMVDSCLTKRGCPRNHVRGLARAECFSAERLHWRVLWLIPKTFLADPLWMDVGRSLDVIRMQM